MLARLRQHAGAPTGAALRRHTHILFLLPKTKQLPDDWPEREVLALGSQLADALASEPRKNETLRNAGETSEKDRGTALQALASETGEPEKVCYRAMERADRRGLLDYGVSLRTAWLADKGRAVLIKSDLI